MCHGTVEILNAAVTGDFTSTGFATSKASDAPINLNESSNDLTQYYDYVRWLSYVAYYVGGGYSSTSTLTPIQRAMLSTNGLDVSIIAEGNTIFRKDTTGTYRGTAFTSIWYVDSEARTHSWEGKVIDNVLWIIDVSGFNVVKLEDTSYISTATIGSNTVSWSDQYIYQGYLLTSAFLSDLISDNSIPTGTNMRVTSGTVTLNGSALTPSHALLIYINITASSLRIYTTDSQDVVLSDVVFSEGNFYQANAFAFSSAIIASSLNGIKTMHIVPFSNGVYDIGTSTNKYKDIWGTVHFS